MQKSIVKNIFIILTIITALLLLNTLSTKYVLPADSAGFIIIKRPAKNFALFTLLDSKRHILFKELALLPPNGLMILNFTSFTCKPCRIEIPELEEMANDFKKRIKLWIIYTDSDRNKIKSNAKSIGIHNTIVVDAYRSVSNKYNVKKFPMTFVIDRNRNIRVIVTGYTPRNMSRLKKYLER